MSGKAVRETLGFLAVVASMVFVGLEIRTSNVQARAAAYQAIGIATSEFHQAFDDRLNRLYSESLYAEGIERWTLGDWDLYDRSLTANLRMLETILLQVEQGLLPPDAMQRLGYNWGPVLGFPAIACLWPVISEGVGDSVRQLIEGETPVGDRFDCQVDVEALREQTILGDLAG
jgi:hypothetical protein